MVVGVLWLDHLCSDWISDLIIDHLIEHPPFPRLFRGMDFFKDIKYIIQSLQFTIGYRSTSVKIMTSRRCCKWSFILPESLGT
jgi:hypothetical protein